MVLKSLIGATCTCLAVASFNADATMVSRLGGLAYYDDVANLTWLTDANAAGTPMNWADANTWAASLNVDGVTGWRLPDTLQPDASCTDQSGGESYGFNCTGSEMGNLFYNSLGNTAGSLTNTGPFSNVQSDWYWTATASVSFPGDAWWFSMDQGYQGSYFQDSTNNAWAVHSGDVGAVPIPAAAWLFGSGLIGLAGVARQKKLQ